MYVFKESSYYALCSHCSSHMQENENIELSSSDELMESSSSGSEDEERLIKKKQDKDEMTR